MAGRVVVGVVLLIGVAAASVAWWHHWRHPGASDSTVSINRPAVDPVLDRIVRTPPMARPRDFFRCITKPEYLTVEEAATSMFDDEVVLGLEIDGDCRAYPINYLNDHEMVREKIGTTPLLVTW